MIEGPTDEPSLKGLADAIKLLYDTGTKEWTADDIISLVDELSGKKKKIYHVLLSALFLNKRT